MIVSMGETIADRAGKSTQSGRFIAAESVADPTGAYDPANFYPFPQLQKRIDWLTFPL